MVFVDDDDEDSSFEEWFNMSEAEQERELTSSMNQYNEMIARMDPLKRYRYFRKSFLKHCVSWRKHHKQFKIDLFHEYLKSCQVHLVKLRLYKTTGIWPGEA